MNEQVIADAIARIEILLLESEDTISTILSRTGRPDIVDRIGHYTYRETVKDAFRKKHGKAMAPWREERTGITDQKYKSMDVERQLYPSIQLAKKLMVNTQFSQAAIGKLANVTPGQILMYLKREGSGNGKTFRKEHASDTSVYPTQPATRKRIYIHGGMRLKLNDSGIGKAVHTRKDVEGKATLSISIVGLSFTVARLKDATIVEERIHVKDTLLVKTGFLTGSAETVTSSDSVRVPISLPFGDHTNLKASYDLLDNTVTLESDGNNLMRNISFTLSITETDL